MKNLLHKGWGAIPIVIGISFSVPAFAISHTKFVESRKSKVESGLSFAEMTKENVFGITTTGAKQQQNLITGIVTFEGMPMTGVTVKIESSTQKAESSGQKPESRGDAESRTQNAERSRAVTVTDVDGKFSIEAQAGDVLVFSYTGFKTQSVTVGSQTYLTIALEEDTNALKEVIVNAGYYNVKDSERTGSIAKITSKDIEKQPVSNVLAAMQGRMAGVNIVQDGGTPGGGFTIRIRGRNSLRADGNEPLYIIDGVPYSNEGMGSPQTTGALASQSSPLNSINPSDIESIEVLKDADATAIYGSRGANGVVLITTKRGKSGKTSVTVTASSGIGRVTKMLDLMNTEQYLEMRRQAFANDGYEPGDYDVDVNGTWDRSRYTDWQEELIGGTAAINDVRASISGGSGQTQYVFSGNYRSETTVTPGDFEYQRGGARYSMNHTSADDKFKFSFSGGYSVQDNRQAATDLNKVARTLAPNAPALYDENGDLNWEGNTFNNPLAGMRSVFDLKTNDLVANAVLSYEILPNLDLKSSLGYTDVKHQERRMVPSTAFIPSYGYTSAQSAIYLNDTQRHSWIVEPQLHYTKTFGAGEFDFLVGSTLQQQTSNRLFRSGRGFASNALINNYASATTKTVDNSDAFLYRYQAFFGRINYNLKGKYILNATGRRDGSSRFGSGKQFANFGAVGAAWIFSKERMLESSKVISFGKLRASYGTTGNDQIGDYQFFDTYSGSGDNYQGITGMQPSRLYNPNFGWETNRKLEAALEMGFLNDRIFLTGAWYQNRSSDQLVGIPLPGTTGFTSLNANLDATVENAGLEFTLRTVNIDRKDFKWTTSFNISAAKNKLVSYPGLAGSTYANRFIIGESVDIVKVYHFLGVNADTGVYEFEDVNGDGMISEVADKKTVADFAPKYFGGLQNQVQYKNWNLDFLFQFVKRLNYDYIAGAAGGEPYNQRADMANAWQQAGDVAPYQMNTTGYNWDAYLGYFNYTESDATVVDGSYIRLKNIALSYDLPLSMLKGVSCKLTLQGQNLLTFTNYKGGDPEFKFSGYLPPLRVYSAGVQLTF